MVNMKSKSVFIFICLLILSYLVFIKPIPHAEATNSDFSVRVAASTDDAYQRLVSADFLLTSSGDMVGYYSGSYYKYGCGMRFLGVTIPQYSVIVSAYISFTCGASYSGVTVKSYFSCEPVDSAVTFANNATTFAARWATRVGQVAWDSIAAWTKNMVYNGTDISTSIQLIINRTGWTSGNNLVIFWEDFAGRSSATNNAYRQAYSWDANSTSAPLLVISYQPSSPIASSMGVNPTENNNLDTLYAYWTTQQGTLNFYIFGCNITGSWVNDTTEAFGASLTVAWVNISKTPSLNTGDIVQWEQWANNSVDMWGNSGVQSWTITATVTFCFSSYGTIERNGTAIANSTITTYSTQTNLTMSALPTANYTLLIWNTSYTSSTLNPYTFVVVNQTILWCYFWDSGTWNYSLGYAQGYTDGLGNATGGGIFIYARFTMNDSAPYQNQDTVFFNASLSNCSSLPLAYYWEFGDSNASTGETTTHIYLSSGVFIVNLTVVNGSMSDSMFQNITVFATSINITFDWNDLLFGSGAWLPFIAIIIAMFVGVAINKWFIVAAFPIMALMSFLYFDHITTTPALVWEALIMICSAIVLLIYSASRKSQ